MKIEELRIAGTFLIQLGKFQDLRGDFVKTFHAGLFSEAGLAVDYREDFWSQSHKDVLRGMHFQTPPEEHEKLVICMEGHVLDVFLDLRTSSPTFGQSCSVELDGAEPSGIYLPKGIAHGFLALAPQNIMYYKVTTTHSPSHDQGVRWDSFGFDWGVQKPILSARDAGFPAFDPHAEWF